MIDRLWLVEAHLMDEKRWEMHHKFYTKKKEATESVKYLRETHRLKKAKFRVVEFNRRVG